jgi:ammonium transporter, Amt family
MTATAADTTWLITASALVFLMQAGFACLESGLVRAKNAINVAAKNVVDFCIAGLLFWAFGYALMFGPSLFGVVGKAFCSATMPRPGISRSFSFN